MDTSDTLENDNFKELFEPKRRKSSPSQKKEQSVPEQIESLAESPSHQRTTGWSREDSETISLALSSFLVFATASISWSVAKDTSLAMHPDEADKISDATARILLRHIKVRKGKQGDVADVAVILITMATYGMRVYNEKMERKNEQSSARNNASETVSSNPVSHLFTPEHPKPFVYRTPDTSSPNVRE